MKDDFWGLRGEAAPQSVGMTADTSVSFTGVLCCLCVSSGLYVDTSLMLGRCVPMMF